MCSIAKIVGEFLGSCDEGNGGGRGDRLLVSSVWQLPGMWKYAGIIVAYL